MFQHAQRSSDIQMSISRDSYAEQGRLFNIDPDF